MKIANIAGRAHAIVKDGAVDLGMTPAELFERWGELEIAGDGEPFNEQQLEAPSPRPRQVFAVASNYRDRPVIVEAGEDLPVVFTKFPSSIVGPHTEIPLPTDTVDWEVELVVVIGRTADAVSAVDAWDYVAGVTIGQDFSERTLQLGGQTKQFSLAKSFPNFGPTGPFLVTSDELPDRDDLRLQCFINGELIQDARTTHMIFPVPELVARLSAICTLLPGDLIFTGTPGGLGMMMKPPRYLKPGDEVHSIIEGVGEMRNRCV